MLTTSELTAAADAVPYRSDLEARRERNRAISALEQEWQVWLRDEYANGISDKAHEVAYRLAWEYGHSSGYREVENYYMDLVEIANASK